MAKRRSALSEISDEKVELQMTPMIDVTFLLLIFFMCTLKFKVLEGKLGAYLPKDVGVNTTQAEPVEKVDIRLDVVNEGNKRVEFYDSAAGKVLTRPYNPVEDAGSRFIYDDTRVIQYTVGPKTTNNIAEVVKSLEAYRKADPEKKATIAPKTGVNYKDVVIVLDAAIDAGYNDITFEGSFER
ncbi:MAG: biopolymer transporter ExbD [Planctomycetota bacterium]